MSPYLTPSNEGKPRFQTVNERVEDLLSRWEKHGALIIAVDFDDTIYNYSKNPILNFEPLHKLLRECVALKNKVVIYTARNKSRWHEVIEFCNDIDLKISGINEDVIPLSEENKTCGKIYYNILLDDKAGLMQAYLILKETIRRIKLIYNDNNG